MNTDRPYDWAHDIDYGMTLAEDEPSCAWVGYVVRRLTFGVVATAGLLTLLTVLR